MAEGDDLYKTERSAAKSGGVYRTGGADASDIYGEPSKNSRGKQPPKDRDDLSDAEEAGGQPDSQVSDGADSSFYHPSTGHTGQTGRGYRPSRAGLGAAAQRPSWMMKNRKKFLLFGGGGTLLLLPIILFLALLLPSLKLPQLAAEIEGYRLARLSRTFYKNATILTADKSYLDATDVTNADLVGKTPLGKSLSIYKPARVINNMKANGVLDFEYSTNSVGAQKLTSVIVNGNKIAVPDYKYKSLSDLRNNYSERIRFAAQIKASVNNALDGSNFMVRSAVAKKLLSAYGINLLWWEKAGSNYRGKTQAEADRLAVRDAASKIDTPAPSDDIVSSQLKNAIQDAEQAKAECLRDPNCTDWLAHRNTLPPQITDVIEKDTTITSTQKILGVANPVYAAAFPVCIAYDGSADISKDFLNAQNVAAMKAFFAISIADAQQRKGDTTQEAVGALNRELGNIGTSYISQISRGNQNVDTSKEISPQAGRSGEFTVFNALFGGNSAVATAANAIANTACPVATNLWVSAGLAIGNLLLLFVPGLDIGVAEGDASATAAEETVNQTVVEAITSKLTALFSTPEGRASIQNTAKKYASSTIKTGAATEGLTYLSRMIVLAEMGQFISGTDSNDLPNNADKGGVAYNNQMVQQDLYGRPLTAAETTDVEKEDVAYLNEQNQSQSSFTKNLALSNPYSPAGKLAMSLSNLNINSVASFFGNLPHALASIFTPIGSLFSHAWAAAPANADYGMVQFGWSTAEENLIDTDSTYDPLINSEILSASGQSDAIAAKYGKCFTGSIGDLLTGSSPAIQRDSGGHVQDSGDCAPSKLSFGNNEFDNDNCQSDTNLSGVNLKTGSSCNSLVFRWRLEQSYQNTLGDLQGVQDPTGANTPTGGGGGNQAGLTNPFPGGWVPNRLDMGSDGTFSGQIVAPFDGTVTYAADSFSNWGGYMEIKADQQPSGLPTSTLYFAEGLSPIVKSGHVDAGQPIANPAPSPYGNAYGTTADGSGQIEWGVAADGASVTDPLAEASLGAGKCPAATTQSRSMVLAFSDWMQQVFGLGAPTATNDAGCA